MNVTSCYSFAFITNLSERKNKIALILSRKKTVWSPDLSLVKNMITRIWLDMEFDNNSKKTKTPKINELKK